MSSIKRIAVFVIIVTYLCEAVVGVNCVPLVSQIKSAIQAMQGDLEGARKTQIEFAKGVIAAAEDLCPGDKRVAAAILGTADLRSNPVFEDIDQYRGGLGRFAEGLVDAVLGVGHAKGGVHYALGDKKKGDACMIAATKCAAVLAAGAITGGVGGSLVLGAMAGVGAGAATDAVVGAIDKDEHGYYKPCGIVGAVDKIAKKEDVIDSVLEGILDVGGNALGGAGGVKLGVGCKNLVEKARCNMEINRAFKEALPHANKEQIAIARNNFNDAIAAVQKPDINGGLLACHMNDAAGAHPGVGYNAIARGKMAAHEFRKGNRGGFTSIKKIKDAAEAPYADPTLLMEQNPNALRRMRGIDWKVGECAEHPAAHNILAQGKNIAHTACVRKIIDVKNGIKHVEVVPVKGCGLCQQFPRGAVPTDFMKRKNLLMKDVKMPVPTPNKVVAVQPVVHAVATPRTMDNFNSNARVINNNKIRESPATSSVRLYDRVCYYRSGNGVIRSACWMNDWRVRDTFATENGTFDKGRFSYELNGKKYYCAFMSNNSIQTVTRCWGSDWRERDDFARRRGTFQYGRFSYKGSDGNRVYCAYTGE